MIDLGRKAVVMMALAAMTPALAFDPTQSLYRENRAGIEALEQDDPAAALEHFTEAQAQAPDDPRVLYNLGLALARAGKLEEADRAWKRAASLADGELARDAWYNRGVAALSAKDARRAVDSFARALMIDPADEEARRNLELALRAAQRQASRPNPSNKSNDSQQQREQQQPQQQPSSGDADSDDPNQQDSSQQQDSQQQQQQQEQQQQGQGEDSRQDQQQHDSPAADTRQQPPSPQATEDQQQQPADGEQAEAQPSAEGSDAERQGEEELAARLLKMLEQNEKNALRRALRRQRRGEDNKREKDW